MADAPQSQMEDRLPERAFSMRFARLIVRYRFATLMTLLSMLFNLTGEPIPGVPRFEMNTRVRDQWPEHPFIHAQDKFEGRFGTASFVLVEVKRKDGDHPPGRHRTQRQPLPGLQHLPHQHPRDQDRAGRRDHGGARDGGGARRRRRHGRLQGDGASEPRADPGASD
jgi:hypothetical protein